ncbi:MAG: PQQ-binding-like beta-propeller repeat protein, partial [Anaerolineaceae bacterium]|nr:PQQ-binding-like beta-propeller repeat protein [Anaerolineaceae bacterium]
MDTQTNQDPVYPENTTGQDLDVQLRRLAAETHPLPGFTARLRSELEAVRRVQKRRKFNLDWTRPWLAQTGLAVLLVSLVFAAAQLAGPLARNVLGPVPANATPVDGTARGEEYHLPRAALARFGKGTLTSLDSSRDGRLAAGTTVGLCVYNSGMTTDWCDWSETAVQQAVFSPGGDLLAAGFNNGEVKVFDSTNGHLRVKEMFGSSAITGLAWDPSGSGKLAVGALTGSVLVWDWQGQALGWGPQSFGNDLADLDWAINTAGESILALGGSDKLALIDAITGELKLEFNPTYQAVPIGSINRLAFSPDGNSLAYSQSIGVQVLGISQWQIHPIRSLALDIPGFSLAWAPDGQRLAIASTSSVLTFRIADGSGGRSFRSIGLDGSPLTWASSSGNGNGGLYFAIPDGSLGFSNDAVQDAALVVGEYAPVQRGISWTADGKIVTAGEQEIRTWSPTGTLGLIADIYGDSPQSILALSPDGSQLALASGQDTKLVLWDVATNQALWETPIDTTPRAAAFDPAGARLALGSEDGRLTIYDAANGQVLRDDQIFRKGTFIHQLAWGPSIPELDPLAAAWMATDGSSGISIYNASGIATGQVNPLIRGIQSLASRAQNLVFSADGKWIAALQDEQVIIWDASSGAERLRLGENAQRTDPFFGSLAFAPDGKTLANSFRGGIKVWNLETGQLRTTLRGHNGFVNALAWRADGQALASAGQDGTGIVWDFGAGEIQEPTPGSTLTPIPSNDTSLTTVPPTLSPTQPDPILTTITPTPAPQDFGKSDIIRELMLKAQVNVLGPYPSPDGKKQVEVVIYPCTEVSNGIKYSYEQMRLSPSAEGVSVLIGDWLITCGGLGAYGTDLLAWAETSNAFYFTPTRQGVPDGNCGFWNRQVFRYDLTARRSEYLGAGPFSPDGSKLAAWKEGLLHVWDLEQDKQISFPSTIVDDYNTAVTAWSPDSTQLAFLLPISSCTQRTKFILGIVDPQEKTQIVLLVGETPRLTRLSWDILNGAEEPRLLLAEDNGKEWIYH